MKELEMNAKSKLYGTKMAAEKAATSKTKKTGIEHFVFEMDGSYLVMTEEQFGDYKSPEQAEAEQESVEQESVEPSVWVGGSFEQIDTDPEGGESDSEMLKLLETVVEAAEAEQVEQAEQVELVEPVELVELVEPAEKVETVEPVESAEKVESVPFGMKPSYSVELTIPYLGYEGTKYLKTEDPNGSRIRLASSRVHVVAVKGDKVVIKTTPTYAAHRKFVS